MSSPLIHIFFQGFVLQASLVFVLGSQNLFVLESGLKQRSPFGVAFICALCDTLLIFMGVFCAAQWFLHHPQIKIGVGCLGVLFLFWYGVRKLKEKPELFLQKAERGPSEAIPCQDRSFLRKTILLQTLGFSFLNPHAYLDTFVLIGGSSTQYSSPFERGLFGLGASLFSWLWFFSLVTFARWLSPVFSSPKKMRVVSLVSGIILLFLSIQLSFVLYEWFLLL